MSPWTLPNYPPRHREIIMPGASTMAQTGLLGGSATSAAQGDQVTVPQGQELPNLKLRSGGGGVGFTQAKLSVRRTQPLYTRPRFRWHNRCRRFAEELHVAA